MILMNMKEEKKHSEVWIRELYLVMSSFVYVSLNYNCMVLCLQYDYYTITKPTFNWHTE